MAIDVTMFGSQLELEKSDHLSTNDGQVWHRWTFTAESGLTIAMVKSVQTGKWNAYASFENEEPSPKRFLAWGTESEDPEEAFKSLQEAFLAIGNVVASVLRGEVS